MSSRRCCSSTPRPSCGLARCKHRCTCSCSIGLLSAAGHLTRRGGRPKEVGPGGLMYVRHYVLITTSLATLAIFSACNPFASHQKVGQIDPKNAHSSTAWNGTLTTTGGMSGAVDMHG